MTITPRHDNPIRRLALGGALVAALALSGVPAASAQTGQPPNCDQSFNQPAPGTGPEWQATAPGSGPEWQADAPGTGPEWSSGTSYGPEWYSGVPCSNAAPGQGAPPQQGLLGVLGF